jgi:hypothetical protein
MSAESRCPATPRSPSRGHRLGFRGHAEEEAERGQRRAYRGHVTRQLLDELKRALARKQMGDVGQ